MKRFSACLLVLCMVLSMVACSKNGTEDIIEKDQATIEKGQSDSNEEAKKDDEDSNKDSDLESEGDTDVDSEETEEITATEETSAQIDYSYEEAYIATINHFLEDNGNSEYMYDLIYVDEDDIPELVICNPGYIVFLYTYAEGEVHVLMDGYAYGAFGNAGYEYSPKQNCLFNSNSDYAGALRWETNAKINDAHELEWDSLGRHYQMFPEGVDDPWENIDESKLYFFVNNVEVTEEEYNSYRISGDFRFITGRYTLQEIKEFLTTETTPKTSYYTLVMADCTWEEAEALCEAQGGHLVTLNESYELYSVTNLIRSSSNPNGVFYVGATYNDSLGKFVWSVDGSNCDIDQYDWRKGEPSLTGSTEDGRTVDEKFVVICGYEAEWGFTHGLMDVPSDVLDAAPSYKGNIGYIMEIEK